MQNTDTITRIVMQPITISTAGDNIIVAGTPNQYIYVRQILLTTPGGAQVIELKDGSTVLTSQSMQMTAWLSKTQNQTLRSSSTASLETTSLSTFQQVLLCSVTLATATDYNLCLAF